MKARIKEFKNGAMAYLGTCGIGYETFARNPRGDKIDKMICDDYRMALEYFRAFQNLAKNS